MNKSLDLKLSSGKRKTKKINFGKFTSKTYRIEKFDYIAKILI